MIPRISSLLLGIIMATTVLSQDFEVSPVKLFFNADPGSTQIKTVTVKNHTNKTQSFLLSVGDFGINN